MTWLSAALLILASVLSAGIFLKRKKEAQGFSWKASYVIWLLMAVGFGFLAVDELTQFHENLDKWIHAGFHIRQTPLTSRIDDFIILLYGLIGISSLVYYRKEFSELKAFAPYVKVGFMLLFVMVAIDVASSRSDLVALFLSDEADHTMALKWLGAIEEGFKVLAETLFVTAIYACLHQLEGARKATAKIENIFEKPGTSDAA